MDTRRNPDGHAATSSSGEDRNTPRLSSTSARSPTFRSVTQRSNQRTDGPASGGLARASQERVTGWLVDRAVDGRVVHGESKTARAAQSVGIVAPYGLAIAVEGSGLESGEPHRSAKCPGKRLPRLRAAGLNEVRSKGGARIGHSDAGPAAYHP